MHSVFRVRPSGGAFRQTIHQKRFGMKDISHLNRRDFLTRGIAGTTLAVAGSRMISQGFAADLPAGTSTPPKAVETLRFKLSQPFPRRIACGKEGRIYAAANNSVCAYDPQGNLVEELAFSSAPRCVAAAEDDTLFVGLKDHVEVLAAGNRARTVWASPGAKTWLTGITAGANSVFAADAGNRVILRFDRSGKLEATLARKDKEKNIPGLIVPSPYLDVKLGADGLLRVNNPGRHRVEIYTQDGDLETAWGVAAGGIAGFCGCCNPIGLAVLKDGRQVTCEKGFPRVKLFSGEGQFEFLIAGESAFPQNNRAGRTTNREDGLLGGLDEATSTCWTSWRRTCADSSCPRPVSKRRCHPKNPIQLR
jgi:hypothetical protein